MKRYRIVETGSKEFPYEIEIFRRGLFSPIQKKWHKLAFANESGWGRRFFHSIESAENEIEGRIRYFRPTGKVVKEYEQP